MAPRPGDAVSIADQRSIVDMANVILERIVDIFGASGVSLPERRFIHTGQPAFDKPQLVVTVLSAAIGVIGDEENTRPPDPTARTANVTVYLVRQCAPIANQRGAAPKQELLHNFAEDMMVDEYMLLECARKIAPELHQYPIARVVAADPAGAYQATVLNMTLMVFSED